MRKCQRLVEWNLLGHPTVTSGKRQEVSSLGRSHSDLDLILGYYIPTNNHPAFRLGQTPHLTSKPQPRRHISVRICTTLRAFMTLTYLS